MAGDEEMKAKDKAADQSGNAAEEVAQDRQAEDVTLYDSRIVELEAKVSKLADGLAKHGIKIAL